MWSPRRWWRPFGKGRPQKAARVSWKPRKSPRKNQPPLPAPITGLGDALGAYLRSREHYRELGTRGKIPAAPKGRRQTVMAVERGRAPPCQGERGGQSRRGSTAHPGGNQCGSIAVILRAAHSPR